eukprot:1036283-Pyramimonas_sp.AAC.1
MCDRPRTPSGGAPLRCAHQCLGRRANDSVELLLGVSESIVGPQRPVSYTHLRAHETVAYL